MAHLHFLTFGDGSPSYRAAVCRLLQQANDARLFKSSKGYTLERLKEEFPEFWRRHGAFILAHPRGLGYWLWKPFLIHETLSSIPEGDFLIYADAGCEIPSGVTAEIVDLLPGATEDLVAYRQDGYSIRQWTNAITLDRIDGARDHAALPQIAAGLLSIRNSSRTRALVDRWFQFSALDDGALIIDRPKETEAPEFVEHRHDQSVLSILLYLHLQSRGLSVRFLDYSSTIGSEATAPIRVRRNATGVSDFTSQRTKLRNISARLQRLRSVLTRRLRLLLGEAQIGALDYYLSRTPPTASWEGPFNGQANRREIFEAIAKLQEPELIVETGTVRGATTEALAAIGVPVISIAAQTRNFGFARARLRSRPNVDVRLGDSREEIHKLFRELGPPKELGECFAYLAAHWTDQGELREELSMVFDWDPDAIVMVDNFHVSDDAGYAYDTYGVGGIVNASSIEPVLRSHGLTSLYPKLQSSREGGARRGCVVVASDHRWRSRLLSTNVLRLANVNEHFPTS